MQWAGALPVLIALGLWMAAERPLLLVSGDGKLVGLVGPEGRALSAARGGGFAAENWLQNDGDLAEQKLAASRVGFSGGKGERWFKFSGQKAVVLTGKNALAKLTSACAEAALVILADVAPGQPEGCTVIDQSILKETGPLAFWIEGGAVHAERTNTQRRIWTKKVRDVPEPVLAFAGWGSQGRTMPP